MKCLLLLLVSTAAQPQIATSVIKVDDPSVARFDVQVENLGSEPVEVSLEDGQVTPLLSGQAAEEEECPPQMEGQQLLPILAGLTPLGPVLETAQLVATLIHALHEASEENGPLNFLFHWHPWETSHPGKQYPDDDPLFDDDFSDSDSWISPGDAQIGADSHHVEGYTIGDNGTVQAQGFHRFKRKMCSRRRHHHTRHWLQRPPRGSHSRHYHCRPGDPCHPVMKAIYLSEKIGFGVVNFADLLFHDPDKLEQLILDLICHPFIFLIELDRYVTREGLTLSAFRKAQKLNSQGSKQEEEVQATATATIKPNDEFLNQQWYISDTKVNQAWRYVNGQQSRNPVVMVIDTGVNTTHPDLKDNLWINTAEYGGKQGVDDDKNGYVDDINGIRVVNGVYDGNVTDEDGHGTFCTGEIGAVTNNKIGVAGMSWGPAMLTCRFMSGGVGSMSDAAKCIDYAIAQKVKVISASWGGATQNITSLYNAFTKAAYNNISIVVAAGNAGTDMNAQANYPACWKLNNTVTVTATVKNTSLIDYTNYGTNCVDIAAPGDYIYNTASTVSTKSGYEFRGGTSMATPIVAGTIVLMLQMNPDLSVKERNSILQSTVQKDASYASKVKWSGRVDTLAAVLAAQKASKLSKDGLTSPGGTFVIRPGESITFPVFVQDEVFRPGSRRVMSEVTVKAASQDEITVAKTTHELGPPEKHRDCP